MDIDDELPNFMSLLCDDGSIDDTYSAMVEPQNSYFEEGAIVPLRKLDRDCLNRVSFYLKSSDRMRLFMVGNRGISALWAGSLTDLSCTSRTWIMHILSGKFPLRRFFTRLLHLDVTPNPYSRDGYSERSWLKMMKFLSAYDISLLPSSLVSLSVTPGPKVYSISLPKSLTILKLDSASGSFDMRCIPHSVTDLVLDIGRNEKSDESFVGNWPPNLTSLDFKLHGRNCNFPCKYDLTAQDEALPPNLTSLIFSHEGGVSDRSTVIHAISKLTNLTRLHTDTMYTYRHAGSSSGLIHLLPRTITELSSNFFTFVSDWPSLPRGITRLISYRYFNTNPDPFSDIQWWNALYLPDDNATLDWLPPHLEMVHLDGITNNIPLYSAKHVWLSNQYYSVISERQVLATKDMMNVEHMLIDKYLETSLDILDQCSYKLKSLRISIQSYVTVGARQNAFASSMFNGMWAKSLTRLIISWDFELTKSQIESLPDTLEWFQILSSDTEFLPGTKLPSSLTRLVLPNMVISKQSLPFPPKLTHLCIFSKAELNIVPSELFLVLPKSIKYVYLASGSYKPIFDITGLSDLQNIAANITIAINQLLKYCKEREIADFMIDSIDYYSVKFYYRYGLLKSPPSTNQINKSNGDRVWNAACLDGMMPL